MDFSYSTRRQITAVLTLAAALLGAVAGGARADAVASYVSGTVQVKTSGDTSFRPLRMFQRLGAGDVIRCDSDGEVTLTQAGGGARFHVAAGGTATVTADGVTGAQKSSALKGPGPRVFGGMGTARMNGIMGRPGVAPRPILADRTIFNGYYVRKAADPLPTFRWEGEQSEQPSKPSEVASYGFTLFDRFGNVIFHARPTGREATYPTDVPPPALGQPYVWRLVPYAKSGRMIANMGARWGVVTYLSPEDAAALESQAKELQAQADPKDTSALVTLAYLYRDYGVYQRVLELLDAEALAYKDKDGHSVARPGVAEMRELTFTELGPMAVLFAHPFDPTNAVTAAGVTPN